MVGWLQTGTHGDGFESHTTHDLNKNDMKYFAKKVKMYGHTFDSKKEAEHYAYLKHKEDIGAISNLRMQVQFEIIPKITTHEVVKLKTKTKVVQRVLERAAHYTADFVYEENGKIIVAEVKSKGTMLARDYPLRRKLIRLKFATEAGFENYEFREVL